MYVKTICGKTEHKIHKSDFTEKVYLLKGYNQAHKARSFQQFILIYLLLPTFSNIFFTFNEIVRTKYAQLICIQMNIYEFECLKLNFFNKTPVC